jgi:Na+-transporting methylmalonyl-CoA/oxaloacetate decarboxylase gamma subunit
MTSIKIVSRTFLVLMVLVVACESHFARNASPLPNPPTKQEDDWKAIIALHQEGAAALKAEAQDKSQRTKRIAIYESAATKLVAYINTYVTDHKSVTYLRGACRLGLYFELAGKRSEAAACYEICLKHPLIEAPEAVFDNQRIKQLAKKRSVLLALNGIKSDGGSSIIQ